MGYKILNFVGVVIGALHNQDYKGSLGHVKRNMMRCTKGAVEKTADKPDDEGLGGRRPAQPLSFKASVIPSPIGTRLMRTRLSLDKR